MDSSKNNSNRFPHNLNVLMHFNNNLRILLLPKHEVFETFTIFIMIERKTSICSQLYKTDEKIGNYQYCDVEYEYESVIRLC